jgi:membrane fusion protein (multidrug efflux system)
MTPGAAAPAGAGPTAGAVPTGGALPPGAAPRKSGRGGLVVLAIVALVIAVLIGGYYFSQRNVESTDDAQVDGNAVTISPKVSGYVRQLAVRDNQPVKAGDLLLKIEADDYLAARDQARAALALAKAQLENAEVNLKVARVTAPARLRQAMAQVDQAAASRQLAALNYDRQAKLDIRATTQQAKDQASSQLRSAEADLVNSKAQATIAGLTADTIAQAKAQVDQAQAQVSQAQAQLAVADLNLAYTEVRAPQDGRVTMRNVQLGSYVQAGQSLFSLVTPDVWITGNFKENQLDRMRVGQQVDIRVDAYRSLKLRGHIDSIQGGTGSRFSAFPSENATGNFVKIVQRVPVKIVIDSGLDPNLPLPFGGSAEPTVELQ